MVTGLLVSAGTTTERCAPIRRFKPLNLEGIDMSKVDNPVMKMLIEEDKKIQEGRRCSISPDDEWLIFLD